MLTDPLTLGVGGGYVSTFTLSEMGPGARTVRLAAADAGDGTITVLNQKLTISHSPVSGRLPRLRSLFRLDCNYNSDAGIAIAGVTDVGELSAYLVIDSPAQTAPGGNYRENAAKLMLARLLGFLSENATGAPDFDFSSNEEVLKFLQGQP
jgi:hypothetical protein